MLILLIKGKSTVWQRLGNRDIPRDVRNFLVMRMILISSEDKGEVMVAIMSELQNRRSAVPLLPRLLARYAICYLQYALISRL